MKLFPCLLGAVLATSLATSPVAGATPVAPKATASSHANLNQADAVVIGKVSRIVSSTVLESYPGIYVIEFEMSGARWLKGASKAKATFHYSKRGNGNDAPWLPKVGDRLVLSATRTDQNLGKTASWFTVKEMLPATSSNVALARRAAAAPFGAGVIRSIHKTSPDLRMSVAQLAPAKPIKWVNPYGDGGFRLTLTNTGRRAMTVPGVLVNKQTGSVAWRNALVVTTIGKTVRWPHRAIARSAHRPLTLRPGQSVSFDVDAAEIAGLPRWGGMRIPFTFAIGNASASSFYYYSDRHHWNFRVAAKARLAKLGITP